jgi:Protein of unknown function (DUF835)
VTDRRPDEESAGGASPGTASDEAFADAYLEGYADGLREALRELLSHLTRGHTVGELRVLVESRLARIRDDVEVKRTAILGPPNRSPWGRLFRPAAPASASGVGPALQRGGTYLFKEDRPQRAPAFAARAAAGYPCLLVVSGHAPEFAGVPTTKLQPLRLALPSPGLGTVEGELDPSGLGGRIREATETAGGAVVYLDAVELMSTEYSVETTLKFVNWVASQVGRTGSALVVSVDPRALEERDLRRLQRAFYSVS